MSSKTLTSAFGLPAAASEAEATAHEFSRAGNTFDTVAKSADARVITDLDKFLAGDLRGSKRAGRTEATAVPVGGRAKRIFDIVTSSTALVLLSPVMLAIALCIYVSMGRPIFFRQQRLGFRGRSFACLKFRTMVTGADAALARHLQHNSAAAAEWRVRQKLKDDPRVTTIGQMLRMSSLDELPQLFSILKGDMSCVGPRPILDTEVVRYGDSWKDYVKARPGLTGAWQVSGRNRVGYKVRVRLDRWYVNHWSIWLDLLIVLKTMPAVLRFDDTL
ncbi:MAG: sugar transferase [Hyphomicrobium sp.]